MKYKIFGGLAVLALVFVAVFVAHWRFGSVANAIAYLDGHAVQVDKHVCKLGEIDRDVSLPVSFKIINLQDKPLKIVGANVSCSCLLPIGLPLTLKPFETREVAFNFLSPPGAQEFDQDIILMFDGPVPSLELKITGVTR